MSTNGVIAGLVASWIKALTEPRLQAVAERIVPPSPTQKQDVGADPGDLITHCYRAITHRI